MGTFWRAALRCLAIVSLAGSVGCVHLPAQVTSSTITVQRKADDSATGELRFQEKLANGSNYVGFKAPAAISADKIWQLPGADSANALCSDGSLNLTFTCASISLFPAADGGLTVWESDGGNIACTVLANTVRGVFSCYNNGTRVILLNGATSSDSYINTGGNLGIGTNAPASGATVHVSGDAARAIVVDTYGISSIPGIYTTRSNGTFASPSAIVNGDNFAIYGGGGYDGAAQQRGRARMYMQADGDWSAGSTPTRIIFSTTSASSATVTDRWLIGSDGRLFPGASATYDIGFTTSRVSNIYSVAANLSGTQTFVSGGGSSTIHDNSGQLTISGGSSNLVTTPLITNGISLSTSTDIIPLTDNSSRLGTSSFWMKSANIINAELNSINNSSSGSLLISGATTISGTTALNSTATTHSILPAANNTYDLGSAPSLLWAHGYFNLIGVTSLFFNSASANGNAGVTSATCSSFNNGLCIAP